MWPTDTILLTYYLIDLSPVSPAWRLETGLPPCLTWPTLLLLTVWFIWLVMSRSPRRWVSLPPLLPHLLPPPSWPWMLPGGEAAPAPPAPPYRAALASVTLSWWEISQVVTSERVGHSTCCPSAAWTTLTARVSLSTSHSNLVISPVISASPSTKKDQSLH